MDANTLRRQTNTPHIQTNQYEQETEQPKRFLSRIAVVVVAFEVHEHWTSTYAIHKYIWIEYKTFSREWMMCVLISIFVCFSSSNRQHDLIFQPFRLISTLLDGSLMDIVEIRWIFCCWSIGAQWMWNVRKYNVLIWVLCFFVRQLTQIHVFPLSINGVCQGGS